MFAVEVPFTDPALVLAAVFAVVLAGPLLSSPVRLPPIIGLILGGLLIGPNGLGLVERAGAVELLGGAGLLFLMFQAGLELDHDDFAVNRKGAGLFGVATFVLPMALGTVAHLLLGFGGYAAVLLASCWASHTLLAYPVFQRLGVVASRAVATAVGATIITDVAALLVLVIVVQGAEGSLTVGFIAQFVPRLAAAAFVILWVLPRLAAVFFRRVGRDRISRFLFVALALYTSAGIAEIAGTEAIIGAFLAGLAMNRLVPAGGLLMERIEFFGGTFLVPLFLISVGMLVDPSVALTDPESLTRAAGFVAVVLVSKFLAAALSGSVLRFDRVEVLSMFSLSVAQAAATLAAVFVGLEAEIIDESTVNAVIIVILVTCLVSTLTATRYGPMLPAPPAKDLTIGQRVLVGVTEGADPGPVIEIAAAIAAPESGSVIPVQVLDLESTAAEVQTRRSAMVDSLEPLILATGAEASPTIRLDLTPNAGLLHAAVEQQATCLVLGWRGYTTRRHAVLGEQLDVLLPLSPVPVLVHRDGAESGARRVVLAVTGDDFTPVGRRTLRLTVQIAQRISASMRLELKVVTPADDPVIAEIGHDERLPEIIVDDRRADVALAEHVFASDLLVLGIPRALDGLGAGTARVARAVPACRIVAVAAR